MTARKGARELQNFVIDPGECGLTGGSIVPTTRTGGEQEDEDEDFSDLMDEEVLEELIQSKKAERRALRELESVKRMLDGAEEDGGMMGVMRQEMDQMKHELAGKVARFSPCIP